jgi:hypothetical protein
VMEEVLRFQLSSLVKGEEGAEGGEAPSLCALIA